MRAEERELKRILDEAFRAFEAGDDASARRLCRDALAIDPDSSTAHSLMGLLYEREGRASEATGEFAKVVTHNPTSSAERRTLRRLRGELGGTADEEDAARTNRTIIAIAGTAAVLVFLALFLGIRGIVGVLHRGADNNIYVASANVDEDLELARQAFQQGRYQTALDASSRVLKADPGNAVAKEIHDRALAFLKGTEQPPVTQNTPPVTPGVPQTVQSRPAVPGAPAVAVAAAPPGPVGAASTAPPAGGGGGVPRVATPPVPQVSTAPMPPYTPPASAPIGYRDVRPQAFTAYDATAGQRYSSRGLITPPPPANPPPTTYNSPAPAPAERPASNGGNGVSGGTTHSDSYVRVEVRPRDTAAPSAAAPDVAPDTRTATSAKDASQPNNPTVDQFSEQQRRLQQARARRAAEQRRAEREQGQ